MAWGQVRDRANPRQPPLPGSVCLSTSAAGASLAHLATAAVRPLAPTLVAPQEGRGVEVSGYKWADSGHVEHYRRHPHEYAYQISTFLARALRDW